MTHESLERNLASLRKAGSECSGIPLEENKPLGCSTPLKQWHSVGTFKKASTGRCIVLDYDPPNSLFHQKIFLPIERLLNVIAEKKTDGTAYILEAIDEEEPSQ